MNGIREPTPGQKKAVRDFQKAMEGLGLGVSIQLGDGPKIVITELPDDQPSAEDGGEQSREKE